MTLFDDAAAMHSAAVDLVYGEQFVYQPFAVVAGDVNGRMAPDPDRDQITITGAFIEGYARALSAQARKQGVKPERPGHASSRPQLDFDATQLPYAARQGDRVLRVATGVLYHVAERKFPTGGQRQQFDLNKIAEAS